MPWHIAVTDACPIATPYGLLEDGTDKLVGCYENAEMAGEEMDDLLEAEAMIGAVPADQPMRSIPRSGLIERRDAMTAWPEQEFDLRSESNGMLFTGYAAIFDSPSEDLGGFRETIKPGAFKRSISHASGGKRDIKMFLNHNADVVLASTRASTLRLKEDAKGLVAEAQLPNSPWGESVAEAVRRGEEEVGMGLGAGGVLGGDEAVLGAVVVEVVGLDVGDERNARLVLEERLGVLVGLDDGEAAGAVAGVAAEVAGVAAGEDERVEAATDGHEREQGRRCRLAVRAGDGEEVTIGDEPLDHLGADDEIGRAHV